MAKRIIILLIFISLVIVGILYALPQLKTEDSSTANTTANVNTDVECSADADCAVAGCSSQLCVTNSQASTVVTTCEWRDEYACYAVNDCSCLAGKCKWTGSQKFTECINTLRK